MAIELYARLDACTMSLLSHLINDDGHPRGQVYAQRQWEICSQAIPARAVEIGPDHVQLIR
jgi:hypothetical protein